MIEWDRCSMIAAEFDQTVVVAAIWVLGEPTTVVDDSVRSG